MWSNFKFEVGMPDFKFKIAPHKKKSIAIFKTPPTRFFCVQTNFEIDG
jgi:hypothetical protein